MSIFRLRVYCRNNKEFYKKRKNSPSHWAVFTFFIDMLHLLWLLAIMEVNKQILNNMKNLFLPLVIFTISLFFFQASFAQNGQPIVENMPAVPGNNTVFFSILLSDITVMPITVTLKYNKEYPVELPEEVDTVFTTTSFYSEFTVDSLDAGNFYCFNVSFQNSTGSPLPYENCLYTTESSVGIDNNEKKQLKIFPNPFIDDLFIDNARGDIIVVNLLGNEVFKTSADGGVTKLPLGFLPSGVYLVTVGGKTYRAHNK